jgi:hypothetical protein
MIQLQLSEENQYFRRKVYPIAALSTTNPTWTTMELKTGLRSEVLSTDCPSHGRAAVHS